MIGLLQRVTCAQVHIEQQIVAEISTGLLVFIGVERGDTSRQVDRLLERILTYRVFNDSAGKMNLSLQDINSGLLLVPQFTLAADTRKGTRPSFTPAAPPETGELHFNYLCAQAQQIHFPVACGVFGANMQISLVNDGPVTFWLHVYPETA